MFCGRGFSDDVVTSSGPSWSLGTETRGGLVGGVVALLGLCRLQLVSGPRDSRINQNEVEQMD